MGVRLRQIVLVAQDIDWSVATLTALFDTYVAYRDPGIVPAFGGMFNALLGMGDFFLEIVSPTDGGYAQNSTSAKLLQRNGGDCGYMAILQVDDIAHTSGKLETLGRVVLAMGGVVEGDVGSGVGKRSGFKYKVGDPLPKSQGTTASVVVQYHPKDFGTLMETEEQWPPHRGAEGAWLPAGNRWQQKFRNRASSVCQEFAGVDIAIAGNESDLQLMAQRWSNGLECPIIDEGKTVQLDGSVVRFVPVARDGRDGIVGVDLYAAPGKPKAFTECHVHGVRWGLLDRPGSQPTDPLYVTVSARAKL
eukprot:TRINITY_DN58085_c0_g1_i1.p1 TRINITY_DN58085_c0_g1~~TRINITY_DN58085_c0_g1_i1.p1  ORF type:complete len:320 (+),score=33.89 TRINITY_DN58085_c0_g1_i1:51-962(+)